MRYAGDISVDDCWKRLNSDKTSQLVDVRTVPEWNFVGVPVLQSIDKSTLFVEWQRYPDMQVNSDFVGQVIAGLEERGSSAASEVFMLCRSGVRSIAAAEAITAAGYGAVYNVTGGFEGDKDSNGHRGNQNGWKKAGLPWRQ